MCIIQESKSEKYILEEKILLKYYKILDIVNYESDRSCCFTKAYGHYFEGDFYFTLYFILIKYSKLAIDIKFLY